MNSLKGSEKKLRKKKKWKWNEVDDSKKLRKMWNMEKERETILPAAASIFWRFCPLRKMIRKKKKKNNRKKSDHKN